MGVKGRNGRRRGGSRNFEPCGSIFREENRSDYKLEGELAKVEATEPQEMAPMERLGHLSGQASGINILPEGDPDALYMTNPCTSELPGEIGSPFNYHIFSEYQRLKSLVFEAQRRTSALEKKKELGLVTRSKVSRPKDSFCQKLFTQLHGPVDFSHPLMQKRLEIMKDTLVEFSSKDPEDPYFWDQYLDEEIDPEDAYICEVRLLEKTLARYNEEQRAKYMNLSPANSQGAWFVLPRPAPSDIRKQHFPELQPENPGSALSPRPVTLEDVPLENLHLYDPNAEFGVSKPYMVFCQAEGLEISRMISYRIVSLVNQCPFGIAPEIIWERFYSEHKYIPDVPLNPITLLRKHHEEIQFASVKFADNEDGREIVLPKLVAGVIDPEAMLKKLWHAIRCVLYRCPVLATNEVLLEVEKQYGFSFEPTNWGFLNAEEFLRELVGKFGCAESISVYPLEYSISNVTHKAAFLMLVDSVLKDKLHELHGVDAEPATNAKPCSGKPIPRGFLRRGSTIPWMSNELEPDQVYYAKLKTAHDPYKVNVVLAEDASEAMRFHLSLQSTLTWRFEQTSFVPDKTQLAPGMYVMANFQWDSKRWYRVRILYVFRNGNRYLVYGIDFGCLAIVKLEDLRYMPCTEIGEEPAHAIPVTLVGVKPPKKAGRFYSWNYHLVADAVRKRVKDDTHLLRITLVDGHYSQTLGCVKWTVTCDVILLKDLDAAGEPSRIETVHSNIQKDFLRVYLADSKEKKGSQKKNPTSAVPPQTTELEGKGGVPT